MDKAEAIKRIKDHIRVHHIGEYPHIKIAEALNMAISSLANDNNVGCKWIPVSERLPEELKNVLAYTDVGSFVETAHWTGYRWEKTWDFEDLYGVTHWMPLPEPPKED